MGNLTNYHSHSLYCDGRAGMEDFVRFALSYASGMNDHVTKPIVPEELFAAITRVLKTLN